jgi:peptidoglycan/xylan/chitin deacetylase (PgdA/CDA1 family)
MTNQNDHKLVISIDIDSPIKLMEFYKINNVDFNQNKLESFYIIAWERALDFFDTHNIKATFFVVGDELENSEIIRNVVSKAYLAGHEIENHTYSHPFGLARLSDEKIKEEILLCNKIIEKTIGVAPIGFRSPGYNINSNVINIAEDLGIKYDSSGFWSIINPMIKTFNKILFKGGLSNANYGDVNHKLKQYPYVPSRNNWMIADEGSRHFVEFPFPRTNLFGLPFYNNFNLWTPFMYSKYASNKINRPYISYLFHIIEFMDITDGIPIELKRHPNVSTSVSEKLRKSGIIISSLMERYELISTRNFVDALLKYS